MIQIQVTLFDKQGRYKPVASLVKVESEEAFKANREQIRTEGIIKICQKRGWGKRELANYGYTTCKMRVYEK